MSWEDALSPEDRERWDQFVTHTRLKTLTAMAESAIVVQIVPDSAKVDIKFAVELGLCIMLDKPILAVVIPGAPVPEKLALVADRVVEADIDTEEGRRRFKDVLDEFMGEL